MTTKADVTADLASPADRARRRAWGRVLAAALVGQALMSLLLFTSHDWDLGIPNAGHLQPLTFVPFAIAVASLVRWRPGRRTAAGVILAMTVVFQVIGLTQRPQTSNDDLRYVWDAKVQLAGVDPYEFTPNDPALERLHDDSLFTDVDCAVPTGCALLNRPDVHTIYPPVAQAAFVAIKVALGHPDLRGGRFAFQLAAALGVVAVTALLLSRSRRTGDPVWWVALWGWCPIVVSEYANNAHLDWLAVLLSVTAIGAYVALRPAWAGILLGAAIATKMYPALLVPALLRRHPVTVLGAAGAVFALGYVPHVLAVGGQVIGYLPGYLDEEGYDTGSRFLLIGRLIPHPGDTVVAAVVLAGLAWLCWRRSTPERPEVAAVWMVGSAFLVVTPNYGWYAGLLVALVAMTGRWHWLPVALAPSCTYLFADTGEVASAIYALAAVATGLTWWLQSPRVKGPATSLVRPSQDT